MITANTGKTVKFTCISGSEIEWVFYRGFQRVHVIHNAVVSRIGNRYNFLTISNVQPSHQGVYRCISEHDWIVTSDEGKLYIRSKKLQY